MRITPILFNKSNYNSRESAIKYFLIQSISSSLIIFICYLRNLFSLNSFFDPSIFSIIISLSLLIKSGTPPFHFWFPQVIINLNWIQTIILLTWQKLAPLILLSYINSINFILSFIIIRAIIGAIGGINQTNLKNILIYSSFIHTAWLISIILLNEILWWMYFLSYIFIIIIFIYPFNYLNIQDLKELLYLNSQTSLKIIIFLNILSLRGLPPFLGFLIKILSLIVLIKTNLIFISLILLITSFLSFYFYIRLTFSNFFLFNPHSYYNFLLNKKSISLYLIISIFGNIVLPILVLLT